MSNGITGTIASFGWLRLLLPLATMICCFATDSYAAGSSFVSYFKAGVDTGRWAISDGWTNGDSYDCAWSRHNAKVDGDALLLTITKTPLLNKQFSCAEVQSRDIYGYGMYEVRMRPTAISGTVQAFFLYSIPTPVTHQNSEIDIEFLGRYPDKVSLNYLTDGQNRGITLNNLGFEYSKGMNDYAFEWLPDTLRWYANGKLIREVVHQPNQPYPSRDGKIVIMIWNGSPLRAWLGDFGAPELPISVWFERASFTKMGDKCQFPESIVCKRSN